MKPITAVIACNPGSPPKDLHVSLTASAVAKEAFGAGAIYAGLLYPIGIALVTFGFFGAHSVASSWIGARARQARAQAAALYLFFYYLGSATIGTIGGLFWSHAGWPGVVGLIACLLLAALAIGLKLARLPPLPAPGRPG